MQNGIAFSPLICGLAALAVGLFPGILSAMLSGIENFRQSLSPYTSVHRETASGPKIQRGLIVIGVMFIAFGLFATLWR